KEPAVFSIRLRWWDCALLVPLVLLTALFAAGGDAGTAIVLGALVVLAFASRASISERNIAGGYARARALLVLAKWVALFAIYRVIVWLLFVIRNGHWTRDRHGAVAFWAIVGLMFFLAREIYRIGEDAGNWFVGSDMEREVARVLDPLRAEHW